MIANMKNQKLPIIFFGFLVLAFGIFASLFLYSKTLVGFPIFPEYITTISRGDNPKLDENPFNDGNFKKFDAQKKQKLISNSNFVAGFPNLRIPNLINYQTKIIDGSKNDKKTVNIKLTNSNKSEINFVLEPFSDSMKEMICYTDFKQVNESLIRLLRKDKTNGKTSWIYAKIPKLFSIIDTPQFEIDFKEFNENNATKFNNLNKDEARICIPDFDILSTKFDTSKDSSATTFYNLNISFAGNQADMLEFDEVVNAVQV
jgi:hypothetical protein